MSQIISDKYNTLLAQVEFSLFEKAITFSRIHKIELSSRDLDQLIEDTRAQKTTIDSFSLALRLKTLKTIRKYGLDSEKIIEKVVLPEGYNGKILMVLIQGGIPDQNIYLRSGDLWHREILRNTQQEINQLGFTNSHAHPLGGAHVQFERNGEITVYGTSDDFGMCDKVYAAQLIQAEFRDRSVIIIK